MLVMGSQHQKGSGSHAREFDVAPPPLDAVNLTLPSPGPSRLLGLLVATSEAQILDSHAALCTRC